MLKQPRSSCRGEPSQPRYADIHLFVRMHACAHNKQASTAKEVHLCKVPKSYPNPNERMHVDLCACMVLWYPGDIWANVIKLTVIWFNRKRQKQRKVPTSRWDSVRLLSSFLTLALSMVTYDLKDRLLLLVCHNIHASAIHQQLLLIAAWIYITPVTWRLMMMVAWPWNPLHAYKHHSVALLSQPCLNTYPCVCVYIYIYRSRHISHTLFE